MIVEKIGRPICLYLYCPLGARDGMEDLSRDGNRSDVDFEGLENVSTSAKTALREVRYAWIISEV